VCPFDVVLSLNFVTVIYFLFTEPLFNEFNVVSLAKTRSALFEHYGITITTDCYYY